MDMPGIYGLVNRRTKEWYVGRSVNVGLRVRGHFRHLEKNCHPNLKLQASYNGVGRDGFDYQYIQYLPDGLDDFDREKWFCDTEAFWIEELHARLNVGTPGSCRFKEKCAVCGQIAHRYHYIIWHSYCQTCREREMTASEKSSPFNNKIYKSKNKARPVGFLWGLTNRKIKDLSYIRDAVSLLPANRRFVIERAFGFETNPKVVSDISKEMGKSRQWVDYLLRDAFRILKRRLEICK